MSKLPVKPIPTCLFLISEKKLNLVWIQDKKESQIYRTHLAPVVSFHIKPSMDYGMIIFMYILYENTEKNACRYPPFFNHNIGSYWIILSEQTSDNNLILVLHIVFSIFSNRNCLLICCNKSSYFSVIKMASIQFQNENWNFYYS